MPDFFRVRVHAGSLAFREALRDGGKVKQVKKSQRRGAGEPLSKERETPETQEVNYP